jgi:hypothetical protein
MHIPVELEHIHLAVQFRAQNMVEPEGLLLVRTVMPQMPQMIHVQTISVAL